MATKKTAGWAKANRAAAKKSGAKRHPAASGGKWVRPSTRLAIYHRDGFCCVYCGKGAEEGAALTLDHLHAFELGGSNDATNLVTACVSCNSAKQAKSIREWFRTLRARHVDTTQIARRVRNAIRRTIDRAEGRRLAALRHAA